MATKKKMLQAAAGQAGGAALDITDVFSTYLYDGTGSAQTITNGIDLAGEGGLVWIKKRNGAVDHYLADTERGATKFLVSNTTDVEDTNASTLTSFNSNGFTIGDNSRVNSYTLTDTFASWTFRKAPKFFDVVTYTGDGVNQQAIPHNLGSIPGTIIIKNTSSSNTQWKVYHRSLAANDVLNLALTSAAESGGEFGAIRPTSSVFYVGSGLTTNQSNETYVAYLFAHNDGDGEFGPDGDQDIIKCGSYTGNGSTDGPEIDLGFEPQWVMIKRTDGTAGWSMWDSMRGVATGGGDQRLFADTSDAEVTTGYDDIFFTSTGFGLGVSFPYVNASGGNYIYIAIRRGPLAPPESGTEVFDITSFSSSLASTTNKPDALLWRQSLTGTASNEIMSKLTNTIMTTDSSAAEYAATGTYAVEMLNSGVKLGSSWVNFPWALSFTRAPGFFDVVAYTGNGVAGRTVSHNLGVAPEMIWVKARGGSENWDVYHAALGSSQALRLNGTFAAVGGSWNSTDPTSSDFTVNSSGGVNNSSLDYIAYLFATLPGVSKVGSYTGTGAGGNQIDCGFSSGARFVLIKRTDQAGWNWILCDTERGIVSGNDPFLALNDTSAEVTSLDLIDPYSAGFELASNAGGTNASGGSYIFYAIA